MVCGKRELRDIGDVRAAVGEVLRYAGQYMRLTEESAFQLKLTLNELLVNSCTHAGRTILLYRIEGGRLKCCVLDTGGGFDWAAVQQPDSPDAEHGRGVYLVGQVASRVRYNRRGNAVAVELELQS